MNLDKNGLEAALDAHVLGTCPVHEYLDFNAADAKELGVLLPDGESFSVVDIVRHEQWRAASRAILAKAIEAYLAALPGTGDELVADLEHFFDPRDEHEPADVRALALRMAVERGGQTCPVSSYDITNAREQITGEVKEADRLRRELRAAEASLASAREALEWYADRVGGVNGWSIEGAKTRADLAEDNGRRAYAALKGVQQ